MRKLVIYRYYLRALARQSSDQMQSPQPVVIFIHAGRLVILCLGGFFRNEPFMKFRLPIQQAEWFDVISNIIYIVNPDAGGFQAVSNRLIRQTATLADSDVFDANQLFFLD